jgi:DNA replication factor GINS
VVKHASFAAADMPHEREGLTEEERALFDDLVARIRQNRGRVLDTLAGEGSPADAGERESPPSAERDDPARSSGTAPGRDDPAGMLAEAMGAGDDGARTDGAPSAVEANEGPGAGDEPESTDGAPAADPDERTTVRITADVGEIYGVDDRDYDLAAEDVVDLPADNAAPLIEKEAAERL